MVCISLCYFYWKTNKNQSIQVLIQLISAAYPAVLPPPLSPIASRRKTGSAELFTFGRVHIKILAPWETGNQRAHYLPRGQLHPSVDAEPQPSHSHFSTLTGPFVSFTQRGDWVAFKVLRLPTPRPLSLQSGTTAVQGVFVLLGGCDCVEDKQMLLPGRETERPSCASGMFGEWGALEVWASFKGLRGFLEQSPVCDGGGLRQQVQELVRQDKQRSVPTVLDREQIAHRLFLVHGIKRVASINWSPCLTPICMHYIPWTYFAAVSVCLCWIFLSDFTKSWNLSSKLPWRLLAVVESTPVCQKKSCFWQVQNYWIVHSWMCLLLTYSETVCITGAFCIFFCIFVFMV